MEAVSRVRVECGKCGQCATGFPNLWPGPRTVSTFFFTLLQQIPQDFRRRYSSPSITRWPQTNIWRNGVHWWLFISYFWLTELVMFREPLIDTILEYVNVSVWRVAFLWRRGRRGREGDNERVVEFGRYRDVCLLPMTDMTRARACIVAYFFRVTSQNIYNIYLSYIKTNKVKFGKASSI